MADWATDVNFYNSLAQMYSVAGSDETSDEHQLLQTYDEDNSFGLMEDMFSQMGVDDLSEVTQMLKGVNEELIAAQQEAAYEGF